jgi:hypothetical protein
VGEGPVRNVFTAFADFDVDEDGGFQLGRKNVNLEDPFCQVQPEPLDHVQAADSLAIHFRSNEDRTWSLSSSSFRTRHSGSPGPGLIAIGTWTGSYVFHPLSLAPQHLIPREANLASVGDEDHASSNCAASNYATSSYGYPGTIDSDDLVDEEEEQY